MTARRRSALIGVACKVAAALALLLAVAGRSALAVAGPPSKPVREIDPAPALGAVVLLAGGLVALKDNGR